MSATRIPYLELGAPISPPEPPVPAPAVSSVPPAYATREQVVAHAAACRACPHYTAPAASCECLGLCHAVEPPAVPLVTLASTTCPRGLWPV